MPNIADNITTPWYKQFWPWFLLSIPLAAIILSMVMVTLAIKGKDTLVSDNYYKDGLAINQRLEKDQQAANLKIHADIKHSTSGLIELRFHNQFNEAPPFLILKLIHPTVAGRDQQLTLIPNSDNIYTTQLPQPLTGRWNIQLFANDSSWRVRGVIALPADDWTALKPDV